MTKYQIFAPNGTKVCVVDIKSISYIVNDNITIYKDEPSWNVLFKLPIGWAAIPLDNIVSESNEFTNWMPINKRWTFHDGKKGDLK